VRPSRTSWRPGGIRKVVVAKDGREAIQIVQQEKMFDIIFLDVKMPGFDGVVTFEEIHKIRPEIPVIMVTAYSADEMTQEALGKGAYACLFKPIDMEKLVKLLDETWEKKKRGRGVTYNLYKIIGQFYFFLIELYIIICYLFCI
jgi:two-component system response regulator AtoC